MAQSGDKPLYSFPPPVSRSEQMAKAAADLAEHRKMRRQMYTNMATGAGIMAISMLVPFAVVRILLLLIGLANIVVGLLLYRFYSLSRGTGLYTRIYEDRLEHCQYKGLTGEKLYFVIYFDEVTASRQDSRGTLILDLEPQRSSMVHEFKVTGKSPVKISRRVCLHFPEAAPKLKLVKDYHEKIKYPKKNYRELTDEDDYYSEEDMGWDKLHKHGL